MNFMNSWTKQMLDKGVQEIPRSVDKHIWEKIGWGKPEEWMQRCLNNSKNF